MRATALATFFVVTMAVAVLLVGCDPGRSVHYENRTSEALFVEVNQTGLSRLSPGKNYDIGYLSQGLGGIGSDDSPMRIHVVDTRGCTVLMIDTTVLDFKQERKFSLIVNQADLPPPSARAPCDARLADIASRTQD
jgi:hypothetical protein